MEKDYVKIVERYSLLDKWIVELDKLEHDANRGVLIAIDTLEDHYYVDPDLIIFMVGSARLDVESEHAALYNRIRKHNMKS